MDLLSSSVLLRRLMAAVLVPMIVIWTISLVIFHKRPGFLTSFRPSPVAPTHKTPGQRPKPRLDARGLARRLKPYEVKSTKIRISERTFRGYRREGFEEVWDRWCPPVVSPQVEQVKRLEQDPTRPF